MTVTVLPGADQVHDEHARIAFEYIESHGVFDIPLIPVTPPWGSNWQPYSAAIWTPSYTLDQKGNVKFSGLASPIAAYGYNATTAVVLQLPSSLIPVHGKMFTVIGQDSVAAYFLCRADLYGQGGGGVGGAGALTLVASVAGTNNGLPGGYVSLSSISYNIYT